MPDTKERLDETKEDFDSEDDRLGSYKRDIINDADDMADQRDKANEDFRFINPGGMWETWNADSWANRTRLEFDQITEFKNMFLGQWEANRVGVIYKPEDLKTSDDDADLLNGVYRADFKDENGKIALSNAVDELAICGYGCLKIGTKFVDEEDPENELQRADFRPIYNAYNMVFWDRASQWINKKDARHCTLLEPYTPESFKEAYPDEEAISAYEPHTRRYNDFTMRTKRIIYVATRYTVVRKRTVFHVYGNEQTGEIESYSDEDYKLIKDDLKKSKIHNKIRTRVLLRRSIEKSIFTGLKFLQEPKRIVGKWIPIIPFYGYRSYVDGIERYHGLVRKMMDAQRLLNMIVSQLAENSASNGQEIPIFDPEQVPTNIANLWADKNNKPFMLAKTLTNKQTGEVIATGPTGYLKPAQVDGNTSALMEQVLLHIRGQAAGSQQEVLDPDASGKAIIAMKKRDDLKTSVLNNNIITAVEHLGVVYGSIAEEIYDSKRLMRTIGEDGTEAQVEMFKEIMDSKTGLIIQANTIAGKKFKAYADVGPQYDTMREQSVEDIKGMMELLIKVGPASAKYIPVLTSLMLENINGVGLSDLKDMVRRDLILQGIKKPETDEEKAMVQKAAQNKQTDPQKELMKAATDQAASEGAKFRSEARNLDSKSIDNVASARKKAAETRKILSEMGQEGVLRELLSATLKRAEKLPFPGSQRIN